MHGYDFNVLRLCGGDRKLLDWSRMPHKHNAARRHHIGKMKFKVTNWAEYEAGFRRRGSLTLWITPEALSGWAAPRRKTRGGQPLYSDLAIETTLMLGMVFGLRLRQSEGLLSSVLEIMALDLPVPDHTTLSRRARTWKPTARGNDQQHVADGPIHVLVDSTGLKICGAAQCVEKSMGQSPGVTGASCIWRLKPIVAGSLLTA